MPAVLVVEYNADFAQILCEVARDVGFACSIASSTDEALEALHTSPKPPDFILADVMVPGMSVEQLLHAVRASPALAKIRFGLMTAGFKHEVPDAPVDVILKKPFTLEYLLTILRSALPPRGSGTPVPST